MNILNRILIALAACVLAAGGAACGGSSDDDSAKKPAKTEPAAEQAGEEKALPLDEAPFTAELASAGFKAVAYQRIPIPVAGKKGEVVVYQSKSRGGGGGVLCFEEWGNAHLLTWHWYFDEAPVSVAALEIDEDGLWDLRVETKRGDQIELIQDDTFTLTGGRREDRIALNGTTSDPLDAKYPLWHCFDGDSSTVWMSRVDGQDGAYIELQSPLGVAEGILAIQAPGDQAPKKCEVRADGKKLQEIDLAETDREQLVQLDPAVRKAKTIRLIFKSAYGNGEAVAVAELGIK